MKGERSNSVDTRLGARLTYANQKQSDQSAQPFVEVNWLYSNAKSDMTFNNHYTFSDDMPASRVEIKAGAEGQISPNRASGVTSPARWGRIITPVTVR